MSRTGRFIPAGGWNKPAAAGYKDGMTKRMGIGLMTALAFLTVGRLGARQPGGPAMDVEKLGPQVGAVVPDFTLPDQRGTTHSLKSLMGPKGAILVFFRSADW